MCGGEDDSLGLEPEAHAVARLDVLSRRRADDELRLRGDDVVERADVASAVSRGATIEEMAETDRSLKEQLDEIGAQLDWVRDYL